MDAAALLAVLLDEPGQDVVFPVLRGSYVSAVNASECCSRAVERGGSAAAVLALIRQFEVETVAFDLRQAIAAADLRQGTRHLGLSLGDRACLALADSLTVPIYTGDRRLAQFSGTVDVRLIR